MLNRCLLIGFTCCLLTISVPAIASNDSEQQVTDPAKSASELIQAYSANKSPSPQDLEKLLAEPAVRDDGPAAVISLMERNLAAKNSEPSAPFDPGKNIRLFNLLEILVKEPSTSPAANQEATAVVSAKKYMTTQLDQAQASGLQLMVETFTAVPDIDSALSYYDRLKLLREKFLSSSDLYPAQAGAALSLIRLYCQMGDLPSAVKFYSHYHKRDDGAERIQAAASLTEAFSEAGRLLEALRYFTEVENLSLTSYVMKKDKIKVEKDKIKAGRALISAYRKAGDMKTARELEYRIAAEGKDEADSQEDKP